jgi:hypothetical protein
MSRSAALTVFEIASAPAQPRKLTRCVLQITALLDMFQAELARVPGVRCGDIGLLASGRQCSQPATSSWSRAVGLVRFYQLLIDRMQGDGVAMRHWLRVEDATLGGIPHRMLVDENRMNELLEFLLPSGA